MEATTNEQRAAIGNQQCIVPPPSPGRHVPPVTGRLDGRIAAALCPAAAEQVGTTTVSGMALGRQLCERQQYVHHMF